MIATAVALIGVLAAGLVVARFLRSCELQDLALTLALVVAAGSNLFLSALPSSLGELHSNFVAWAPFAGRVLGAVLFAFSVAVPDRIVPQARRAVWLTIAGGLALVGAIAALTAVLSPGWSSSMADAIPPRGSDAPHLTGDTIELVVLAVTFALYLLGAAGFVKRAETTGDELFAWFA